MRTIAQGDRGPSRARDAQRQGRRLSNVGRLGAALGVTTLLFVQLLHVAAAAESVAAAAESVAGAGGARMVGEPPADESLTALLARLRDDPAVSNDAASVGRLARKADTDPPSVERAEARMLVAEAWLGRMHRPNDALGLLREVADDTAADSLTRRLAEREIVDTLLTERRLGDAVTEATTHADALDAPFVRRVVRWGRRRVIFEACVVELLLFATLVTMAVVRKRRTAPTRGARRHDEPYAGERRVGRAVVGFLPVAGAFALYLAGVGAFLASRYETGNAAPFVGLAVASVPVVFLARGWSATGSSRPGARTGRAVLCAASMLASAFVVLDVINPSYLDGFGL